MATKYLLNKTNPYKDIYVDRHGNKWCRIDDENMPMNEKIVEKIFKLFQASWEKKLNKLEQTTANHLEAVQEDVYNLITQTGGSDKQIIKDICEYFNFGDLVGFFDEKSEEEFDESYRANEKHIRQNPESKTDNDYLKELNEKHLKQILTQESVKKTCKRLAEQIAKNCPFIKPGQKISFTVQVNI